MAEKGTEAELHAGVDRRVAEIRAQLAARPDHHTAHARKVERERPEKFADRSKRIAPVTDPRLFAYPMEQRLEIPVTERLEAEMIFARLTPQEKLRVKFRFPHA